MHYRKLHIGNEVWEFVIGSGAKIRNPKGKVTWIEGWRLLGYESKQAWEKVMAEDDGDSVEAIIPSMVKRFIEENLI